MADYEYQLDGELIVIPVHDLKEQGVEGLVGMTFLKQFKWCVDPQRQIISVK